MELSRKTFCFACSKGNFTLTQRIEGDLGPQAVYTCDLCPARKDIYLDSFVLPLQTYKFPNGRTITYCKRRF